MVAAAAFVAAFVLVNFFTSTEGPRAVFERSLRLLDANQYEDALALIDEPCRGSDAIASMAAATTMVHERGMAWTYALPVQRVFRDGDAAILWLAPNLPGIPAFALMHRVDGRWKISCTAAMSSASH